MNLCFRHTRTLHFRVHNVPLLQVATDSVHIIRAFRRSLINVPNFCLFAKIKWVTVWSSILFTDKAPIIVPKMMSPTRMIAMDNAISHWNTIAIIIIISRIFSRINYIIPHWWESNHPAPPWSPKQLQNEKKKIHKQAADRSYDKIQRNQILFSRRQICTHIFIQKNGTKLADK